MKTSLPLAAFILSLVFGLATQVHACTNEVVDQIVGRVESIDQNTQQTQAELSRLELELLKCFLYGDAKIRGYIESQRDRFNQAQSRIDHLKAD